MQKIPTMYTRNEAIKGHPVQPDVKPECAWVEAGEGIATHKLDGTNVKIKDGTLFKRQKPKEEDYTDAAYVQVEPADPSNKYIWEAFERLPEKKDGIYEAVGPKIQGGVEKAFTQHTLVMVVPALEIMVLHDAPRTFDALKEYLTGRPIEGIVFHHPDGRFAKIKRRDFQIPWPA